MDSATSAPPALHRASLVMRLMHGARRSATLRTGAVFGCAGAAFVIANLALARQLAPEAYGTLALMVALATLGSRVGTLGLGVLVVRDRLPATPRLGAWCLGTSGAIALAVTLAGAFLYRLEPGALVALVALVMAGGGLALAAATLQSEERFIASTLLSENANYLLLLVALVSIGLGIAGPLEILGVLAVAQIGLVAIAWWPLLRARPHRDRPAGDVHLGDLVLLTGSGLAGILMLQLERLTIPLFLDLGSLATFAVLAACTIAPFRLFEVGVYRTLLPRLRNATDAGQRRRLLLRQIAQVGCVLVTLGPVLVLMVPPSLDYALAGKYQFGHMVVLAAVAGGQVRVLMAFTAAAVQALAGTGELVVWNAISWLAIGMAVLGGASGAAYGLEGFLWGVAAGGAAKVALSLPLIARALR